MLSLRRRLPKIRGERGFTMLEIIVVLAVVAVMAGVLSPMILNYVDDARKAKAESDVRTLSSLILQLTKDVQHFPIYFDGTKTTGDPDIELLQGPGNDPAENDASGHGWLPATSKKDDLENHLLINKPGGTTSTTSPPKYATSGRSSWRGPYTDQLTPDPWGNRYLVNIKNGDPGAAAGKVIWVLSAGPNGKIETDPTALTDSGPVPGGDDVAVRVR